MNAEQLYINLIARFMVYRHIKNGKEEMSREFPEEHIWSVSRYMKRYHHHWLLVECN